MATWNPFKSAPAQPANGGQPGQGGNPAQPVQTFIPGQTPGQQQAPAAPQDPLAAFAKMFDNTPNGDAPKAPEFKLSPDAIKQAASGLDFADTVPKDLMERIKADDPTAIAELVNNLGRKLYSTSLEHNSLLTDRFVGARSEFDRKSYGSDVNKTLAKNSLKSIAEQSPVAAAHLQRIADDLYSKNPDATPQWIEEQTKRFFVDMARMANPEAFGQPNDPSQRGKAQETDWDEFFDGKKAS